MTRERLTVALRALANDDKARSETARLRDVFDEVETVLRSGVRRKAVVTALQEQGFKMTLASFKSALERIREERAEAGIPSPTRMIKTSCQRATTTPAVHQITPLTQSNLHMGPEAVSLERTHGSPSHKPVVERPKTFTRTKKELNLDE
ncbi:hypothetical protein P3T16_002645 [Paraburkholderia sp. GAS42]